MKTRGRVVVVGTGVLIDVLDRVLDSGIMIDSWQRVNREGIAMPPAPPPVPEPSALEELSRYLGAAPTAAEQAAYLHGVAVGMRMQANHPREHSPEVRHDPIADNILKAGAAR